MIGSLSTSGSALVAQRTRLDVISGNLANAFATVREDGAIEPYRRRIVTFAARDEQGRPGVHVHEILEDESEFRLEYDPGHQHAIPEGPMAGYVRYPNVNIAAEYVDAMLAARAFEANVAMMNVTRSMLQQAMQVLA